MALFGTVREQQTQEETDAEAGQCGGERPLLDPFHHIALCLIDVLSGVVCIDACLGAKGFHAILEHSLGGADSVGEHALAGRDGVAEGALAVIGGVVSGLAGLAGFVRGMVKGLGHGGSPRVFCAPNCVGKRLTELMAVNAGPSPWFPSFRGVTAARHSAVTLSGRFVGGSDDQKTPARFALRSAVGKRRPMIHPRLLAALVGVALLSACEKPAGPAGGQVPASPVIVGPNVNASAIPDLPVLPDPVFAPQFVAIIAADDLFEIAEGKLAMARSANSQVKDYATAVVAGRAKSLQALQAAVEASGESTELPTVTSDDQQSKITALTATAGAAFDKAYVADQIAAQQGALVALKAYARRGDTPSLKSFAASSVAMVEDHLTRAKALQTAPS